MVEGKAYTSFHLGSGDRIAVEVVRQNGLPSVQLMWKKIKTFSTHLESVLGKVVREELMVVVIRGEDATGVHTYFIIDQRNTENIGQEEDDLVLRVITFRRRDVAFHTSNLLDLPYIIASGVNPC